MLIIDGKRVSRNEPHEKLNFVKRVKCIKFKGGKYYILVKMIA